MNNVVPIYTPVKFTSQVCGFRVFSTSKWGVIWSAVNILFLIFVNVAMHLIVQRLVIFKLFAILKTLNYTIVTLCISVVLVYINHYARYKIQVLVKKIQGFWKQQREFPGVKSDDYRYLTVYFYLVHITLFVSYVTHISFLTSIYHVCYATGEFILLSFITTIAFQIVSVASSIGKVLDLLNNCWMECKVSLENNPKKSMGLKIELLMDVYGELFDMVDVINESLGIPVLFMYLMLLLYLVSTFTTVLKFTLIVKILSIGMSASLGVSCLICLILAYLISSSYSDVKGQLRLAALYVFEIILSQSKGVRTTQDALMVLHGCLTTRPFDLTAADFFDVDFTLMFSLVGSVSYYVVVFVQM